MGFPMPVVIEKDGGTERAYDLYSRLLKDRIIFVGTEIEPQMANAVIAQLLFLENQDSAEDIQMYINSPGGHVSAGMAIYDVMKYVKPDIATLCVVHAVSMGRFLLAGVTPGKRFSLPHSRIMMHAISGGASGRMWDVEVQYEEMQFINNEVLGVFSDNTGHTLPEIKELFQRDKYMSPAEAQEFGIIDSIREFSNRGD